MPRLHFARHHRQRNVSPFATSLLDAPLHAGARIVQLPFDGCLALSMLDEVIFAVRSSACDLDPYFSFLDKGVIVHLSEYLSYVLIRNFFP